MTKYRRIDPKTKLPNLCAMCGKEVILDTGKKTSTCGCGTFENALIPMKELLMVYFEKVE